ANATPASSTAQNPSVTFSTAGARTVTLTVTDSGGLADPTPASVSVNVAAQNQAPNGTITPPATVTQGVAATFQGSATDPNGNPVTYAWNFGANATPATSTAQNPSVTFSTTGARTVSLTVTDSGGLADPTAATVQVTVVAAPAAPAACTDADRDGYFAEGGVCGPRDCNDSNAAINPGAAEICGDGIDNDCDGTSDTGDKECNGTDCLGRFFAAPVFITSASWDSGDRELDVRGSQAQAGAAVTIFNANSGALIGTAVAGSTGSWRFEEDDISPAPCRVRVAINGQSAERVVSGAPATCSGGTPPPPPATNQAPNGTISSPAGNVSVAAGGTVNFQGSGTDPDSNTPLTYFWNFGGGATNSTAQNPGNVQFNTAGTFTVTFTVRDATGLADPSPATRMVTVTRNQAPQGTIIRPTRNVTVERGNSVSFQGIGSDPDGNTPLAYSWNFGGGATNSTLQNPRVRFNTNGTFTVRFTVRDARGLADPTPATLTVTVVDDD
ncbi:MAG: repeat protein, partial [Proteobacteria bacterium]|nr:repeat protein [Pseudomonadota bacterium]